MKDCLVLCSRLPVSGGAAESASYSAGWFFPRLLLLPTVVAVDPITITEGTLQEQSKAG